MKKFYDEEGVVVYNSHRLWLFLCYSPVFMAGD